MNIFNLILGIILTFVGAGSAIKTVKFIFTPLKKIATAKGNSTILGTVVAKEVIFSPITKTPCVYCVYRTFQRGGRFKSGTTSHHSNPRGVAQVVAGSGVKHSPFILKDDSGEIYIQGRGQLFGNPKKQITVYDDTKEYSETIKEFKLITKINEGEDRQYEEDIVIAGDVIYVHGNIKIENNQKVMYPDIFSFKTIQKVGSSPLGIIVTIIILAIGINLLIHAF